MIRSFDQLIGSQVLSLPADLPAGREIRITWHWAASRYRADSSSLAAYHFVIEGDGRIVPGKDIRKNFRNALGVLPFDYARHTAGANTDNIGISCAAMMGASEREARRGEYGSYPVTAPQIKSMIELTAALARLYKIPIDPDRVLGHKEHDSIRGINQNRWDFNCIPHMDIRPEAPDPRSGSYKACDWLRARVIEALRIPNERPANERPAGSKILSDGEIERAIRIFYQAQEERGWKDTKYWINGLRFSPEVERIFRD